ncbi:hypothetical protein ACLOJK_004255 [Asimina triloba]
MARKDGMIIGQQGRGSGTDLQNKSVAPRPQPLSRVSAPLLCPFPFSRFPCSRHCHFSAPTASPPLPPLKGKTLQALGLLLRLLPLPTTTTTTTAMAIQPNPSNLVISAIRSPSSRPRRWRHSRITTSIIALISLLLATSAWLSLVFSNANANATWRHRLRFPTHTNPQRYQPSPPPPPPPPPSLRPPAADSLSLNHLAFGIAGSAHLWNRRKHLIKLWWRPSAMRGHIWLEEPLLDADADADADAPSLPPLLVSEDISNFRYTNPTGHPSGLRISRIVSECFHLHLPDVRWFVLGDDDTIFNVDNLVRVLRKYDWREMVYIGGPSESHSANTYFSHSMAFGGGGIAISYPLAEALSKMQDECLERYPKLYGSDDRLHACITELGWDIRGSAHGLLSAHPIAPFISIHHVEAVEPFYPGLSSMDSLKLFVRAMKADPRSFLQRAICYDRQQKLTFSVSLGYVVQVFPNVMLPRELERSEQTFSAWNKLSGRNEFDFDTKDAYRSVCKKPIIFFLKDIRKNGNVTVGMYGRAKGREDLKRKVFCFPHSVPLRGVKIIRVLGNPLSENWHLFRLELRIDPDGSSSGLFINGPLPEVLPSHVDHELTICLWMLEVPRRLCCEVNQTIGDHLEVRVGQCERGISGSVVDTV